MSLYSLLSFSRMPAGIYVPLPFCRINHLEGTYVLLSLCRINHPAGTYVLLSLCRINHPAGTYVLLSLCRINHPAGVLCFFIFLQGESSCRYSNSSFRILGLGVTCSNTYNLPLRPVESWKKEPTGLILVHVLPFACSLELGFLFLQVF